MQEARKITKPGAKSSSQYPQRNTIMPRKTIAKKNSSQIHILRIFNPFVLLFTFYFCAAKQLCVV